MIDSPIKPRLGSSGFGAAISYPKIHSVKKGEENLANHDQPINVKKLTCSL